MQRQIYNSFRFSILLCMIFIGKANAQQYVGDLYLTSQAAVDSFNYTSVKGNLRIEGNDITNLDGLSELTSIYYNYELESGGYLFIMNNKALTNLNGLSNLEIIGEEEIGGNLIIQDNDALTSVAGLSPYISWGYMGGGRVEIINNDALANLDGSHLQSFVSLVVYDNDALENIDGLSSLGNYLFGGNIYIGDNNSLLNVNGLSNISYIYGNLNITNNPLLFEFCGIYALVTFGLTGTYNVSGNANNPTRQEILNGNPCSPTFSGELVINSQNKVDAFKYEHVNGFLEIHGSNVNNLFGLSELISVYTLYITNTDITSVNGLSNLISVSKNLIITANSALSEFCGLYPLLSSGGLTGSYSVQWNASNPTQQEIIDGGPCLNTTIEMLTAFPLSSSDDGYLTNSPNNTNLKSKYSEMGSQGGDRHALVRFPNAGVLAGKIIDSAFVYFTANGKSKKTGVKIRIAANDTANAKPISTSRSVELGKALTSAKVDWNNIPVWQDGLIYRSPDIKAVIQEWADIPDHNNISDALLLFFKNNSSNGNANREFSQWDNKPKNGAQGDEKPVLMVYYHTGAGQKVAGNNNEIEITPGKYELFQNYPNPFNPGTVISWQSPVSSYVTLKVYDILGNEVTTLVDDFKEAGNYSIKFGASGLSSGIYFYKLQSEGFSQTKKLILMK